MRCDDCHKLLQKTLKFKDFSVGSIKEPILYFSGIREDKVVSLMKKSNLNKKSKYTNAC